MLLIRLPFSMAQRAIVPSSLAVARTFESSRQLMAVTAALWPSRAWNSRSVPASQTHTPPARSAVAKSTPSGLNSTAVTQSVCLRISTDRRAVADVEDAHDLLRSAQGDQRLAGVDVGGQHGVELVAHLGKPLSAADIVDRRQPAGCRLAPAGQEQLAGAAEAERRRECPRETAARRPARRNRYCRGRSAAARRWPPAAPRDWPPGP